MSTSELRAFLEPRYPLPPDGPAWFCLGYIDGDPSIKKGQPGYSKMRQEWFDRRKGWAPIVARYEALAARDFNLYAGVCLHTAQQRVYATALPSAWLWGDDVPALDCTERVQSSASSQQAWLRLDAPLSARERSTLQRRIFAPTQADSCSSDAVHMVRVPFGCNTKRHGRFAVHMAETGGPVYSVAELRARYVVKPVAPAQEGDEPAAADWTNLPDGDALLNSPRWKLAIERRPDLRLIISEGGRKTVEGGVQNWGADDSDSAQRATLVYNFRSWKDPHHFPDAEIRAVLWALKPLVGSGKTAQQYRDDIDRLLLRYRARAYDPAPTRALTKAVSGARRPQQLAPKAEPLPRGPGRPAGSQEARRAALLKHLGTLEPDAFGRRVYRVRLLARAFKVSERTIHGDMSALVKAEALTRDQVGGNGAGFVILTSDFRGAGNYGKRVATEATGRGATNVLPEGARTRETDETIPAPNKEGNVHTPRNCGAPRATGAHSGGCVPPQVAEAPALPLNRRELAEHLIAEALDMYDGAPVRKRKHLARLYVSANGDARLCSPEVFDDAYKAALLRRDLASVPTLAGLRREARTFEHRADRATAEGAAKQAAWWQFAGRLVAAEMARRPPEPERKPRRLCEALPNPREVGAARQQELFEASGAAVVVQVPTRPKPAAAVEVLPPSDAMSLAVAGRTIVARLQQRIAAAGP